MRPSDPRPTGPTAEQLARGTVLAIAPYAGDEIWGCGGTLALHAAQGDPVHVLVVFEGPAEGLGEIPAAAPGSGREGAGASGGAALGALEYEPWGLPSGIEPTQDELSLRARRLARRIVDLRASTVYAPWHGEQHVDRAGASRAASLALELADFDGEAWGYEVWTPLVADRLVDVSSTWARKCIAFGAGGPRSEQPALLRACEGLAIYRSHLLGAGATHGEAFSRLLDLRFRMPSLAARETRRGS